MECKVLIHEVGKPPVDDGTLPDNYEGKATLHSMIILEKGTASGDTSVMLNIVRPDGKHHLVQITGNIFRMMAGAFNGAHQRFIEREQHKKRNN